jgi:hypothetical protein
MFSVAHVGRFRLPLVDFVPDGPRQSSTVIASVHDCLSTAEAAVCQMALIGYAAKDPVHRLIARCGVVAEPDVVGRNVRTIAFLRSLDLDPVEILGADVVEAAAAWIPTGRRQATGSGSRWRSAASTRPIGSQSLLTAQ